MNKKIQKGLGQVAPSIAFSIEYTEDPHFQWDGDGPDPTDEGYVAYDVDVYARAIAGGETIEGRDSLGGTYDKPHKKDPNVGGYLIDMLGQALEDLMGQGSKLPSSTLKQAKAAIAWLKKQPRD